MLVSVEVSLRAYVVVARIWYPSISSASVRPVVQCGVTGYCWRNSRPSGEVNVNALPWAIWNGPCRQIVMLIWACFGTSRAVIAVGSNVDLDIRPPHLHTCERLHADYSDVRQVQHVEDSSTKCSRNDDSRVSKKYTILRCDLRL